MLYNKKFYDKQRDGSLSSASIILDFIASMVKINSIVDVGCGSGTWLQNAIDMGITDIVGLDGSYAEKELIIPVKYFQPTNLEEPIKFRLKKFDLAISLEVAEHLSVKRSDSFIYDLCQLSDVVLFSAAVPYQGGTGHINENWSEYWAEKFSHNGYVVLDIIRKEVWNNKNVEWWYKQNTFLYVKQEKLSSLFNDITPNNPKQLSLIHPEFYLWSLRRSNDDRITRKMGQDKNYYRNLCASQENKKNIKNPEYGQEFGDR